MFKLECKTILLNLLKKYNIVNTLMLVDFYYYITNNYENIIVDAYEDSVCFVVERNSKYFEWCNTYNNSVMKRNNKFTDDYNDLLICYNNNLPVKLLKLINEYKYEE
jgi:hypothetical protein